LRARQLGFTDSHGHLYASVRVEAAGGEEILFLFIRAVYMWCTLPYANQSSRFPDGIKGPL
jgi:hypothetical protein